MKPNEKAKYLVIALDESSIRSILILNAIIFKLLVIMVIIQLYVCIHTDKPIKH